MSLSYSPAFERAVARVLAHEGGFVNHPSDPGGATNFGITLATLQSWRGGPVSVDDVRRLSREEAIRIYHARYWRAIGADDLPQGLGYAAFDAAVHSGVSRAQNWLKAAEGAGRDEPSRIRQLMAIRRAFLMGLSTFSTFGRGWLRRLDEVEAAAITLSQNPNQRSQDMTDAKPWYLSKAVWGSVVTVIASLSGLVGLSISPQMAVEAVDLIILLITTLSGLFSLWGRLSADKQLV